MVLNLLELGEDLLLLVGAVAQQRPADLLRLATSCKIMAAALSPLLRTLRAECWHSCNVHVLAQRVEPGGPAASIGRYMPRGVEPVQLTNQRLGRRLELDAQAQAAATAAAADAEASKLVARLEMYEALGPQSLCDQLQEQQSVPWRVDLSVFCPGQHYERFNRLDGYRVRPRSSIDDARPNFGHNHPKI
jgi:hypothetical protein